LYASFAFTGPAGVLDIYDLILMPVDEMIIDARVATTSVFGGAGVQGDAELNIDSVKYPKASVRSFVIEENTIPAIWRTNGTLAFLQANKDQRLWFLIMRWDIFGATPGWAGRFSLAGSPQAFSNARYLSLRGER
jgi:hypothetical protein